MARHLLVTNDYPPKTGEPRRSRLEKDDAEPLLFQAKPTPPTVHDEEITRGEPLAQLVVGHATEKANRRLAPGR